MGRAPNGSYASPSQNATRLFIYKLGASIFREISLSIILLFSWGARNYKVMGKFFIGSSINWMLTYYSFNSTSYKIYPEIALDQLFVAKEFILNDSNWNWILALPEGEYVPPPAPPFPPAQ